MFELHVLSIIFSTECEATHRRSLALHTVCETEGDDPNGAAARPADKIMVKLCSAIELVADSPKIHHAMFLSPTFKRFAMLEEKGLILLDGIAFGFDSVCKNGAGSFDAVSGLRCRTHKFGEAPMLKCPVVLGKPSTQGETNTCETFDDHREKSQPLRRARKTCLCKARTREQHSPHHHCAVWPPAPRRQKTRARIHLRPPRPRHHLQLEALPSSRAWLCPLLRPRPTWQPALRGEQPLSRFWPPPSRKQPSTWPQPRRPSWEACWLPRRGNNMRRFSDTRSPLTTEMATDGCRLAPGARETLDTSGGLARFLSEESPGSRRRPDQTPKLPDFRFLNNYKTHQCISDPGSKVHWSKALAFSKKRP